VKFLAALLLSLSLSSQAFAVQSVTDKTFYKKVSSSKGYALIDFYATWCYACNNLHPVLEKLEKRYKNVRFYQLDTDANQNTDEFFSVSKIPMLVLMKDGGNPVVVQIGYDDEAGTAKNIDEAMRMER
jgi:thioredoxin 1